jgi:hypothetical protein
MAKIIRLTENDLASIVRRVISEATQKDRELMSDEFVKSGKLTKDELEDILSIPVKANYLRWLARSVVRGFVESSEIKSFDKYFKIFETVKSPGVTDTLKDIFRSKGIFTDVFEITQLKTQDSIDSFISACDEYSEEIGKLGLGSKESKGLLNSAKVDELKEAGIPLLGVVDNYQIFKVSNTSDESYNAYRKILLQCGGPQIPSTTDPNKLVSIAMCTTAKDHFTRYLNDNPGSAYYVIYNYSDDDSPYQFFYENNEFKNRENKEIF